MRGERNGLKTKVLAANGSALFIHCYGHSVNLAVQDAIKANKKMKDVLDTAYELTKLIKKSPKRESLLTSIKKEIQSSSGGVRTLCPTRYGVPKHTVQN